MYNQGELGHYRSFFQYKEYILSLSSIFFLAIGTGAYLFLIVAFLESAQVPVLTIGSVMSFFSITQVISVYLTGKYYQGKQFRLTVIVALFIQSVGAILLMTLATGLLMWISVSLFGIGLGALLVVLYASAIERRPHRFNTGFSVGIYTALIAGGNALGSLLVGIVTDHNGYQIAFLFSSLFIFVVIIFVSFMADHHNEELSPDPIVQSPAIDFQNQNPLLLWKMGLIMAFLMASFMSVFDLLLPIYGLRAGMTVSVIGGLAGLKLFMAAVSRPFIGYLLNRKDPHKVSKLGFIGMAIFTGLFPFSGVGAFPFIIAGLLGISFGAIRVASVTSTLEGRHKQDGITRRISYYRLSMTFGQIAGPYITGLIATTIIVSYAFISLTLIYLILFIVMLIVLKRKPHYFGLAKIHSSL
jgi:MFS family permease